MGLFNLSLPVQARSVLTLPVRLRLGPSLILLFITFGLVAIEAVSKLHGGLPVRVCSLFKVFTLGNQFLRIGSFAAVAFQSVCKACVSLTVLTSLQAVGERP